MKQHIRHSGLAVAGVAVLLAIAPAEGQQAPPEFSLLHSAYLRIGAVEGPPEMSFAGIVGTVLLPSGEIVVADGGNRVVRWFDASGDHVRSVGREGEAPGEFRNIHWIGACTGGELLVLDPMVGRATFLSAADGDVVRNEALPPKLGFNRPLSCRGEGQLLVLMDHGYKRKSGKRGSVRRLPAPVVRLDVSTGATDTLEMLPGTDFYYASDVPGFSRLPLGGRALAAVGGTRLYVAQNDEETIGVVDLRSGEWTEFEHRLPRPPVTRDAWNAAVSRLTWRQPLVRTRRLLAEVLDEAPVPDRQPAFLAMRTDRTGRLWVRLPASGGPTRWRILDHEGRSVATIALPSNVEPLDIGVRSLVAIERGPLDVQMIRVYAMPRPLQPDTGR